MIGVILYHSDLPGAQLGWAGVELFFVISGFLITGILLDLKDDPRYFQIFYTRRALRILPVYYVVIVVSLLLAFGVGLQVAWVDIPFYLVYVQNYFPQIPSLFSGGIPLTGHTWTLAVEEQFYWLWPLVVLVCSPKALRLVVIGCIVAAPLARVLLLGLTNNPYVVVATLPAQIDALGVGAALALVQRMGAPAAIIRRAATIAVIAGSTALVVLVIAGGGLETFAVSRTWASAPVNALLLSAFVAVFGGVVAFTVFGRTPARALEWPPLVHLGRISYGIYIYNPLAMFVGATLLAVAQPIIPASPALQAAFGPALTYVFALASWRYLETPILRMRDRLRLG